MFKRNNILINAIFLVSLQVIASDPRGKAFFSELAEKTNAKGGTAIICRNLRDKQESKAMVLNAAEKGITLVRRKYDKILADGNKRRHILTLGERFDVKYIKHYCDHKDLRNKYLLILAVDDMLELENISAEETSFSNIYKNGCVFFPKLTDAFKN